jgi:hypothetical protein
MAQRHGGQQIGFAFATAGMNESLMVRPLEEAFPEVAVAFVMKLCREPKLPTAKRKRDFTTSGHT